MPGITRLQTIERNQLDERARHPLSTIPRPFVRWAGSKRSLLSDIVKVLPHTFRRYWEPFLGGGSLFFLLQPEAATLGDSCGELIGVYRAIREDPEGIIRFLAPLTPQRENFYRLRVRRSIDPTARAGEFIYLNKSCWNGLYRVNSRGEFNVPYGLPKSESIFDPANLRACANALSKPFVEIHEGDFEEILKGAQQADLVFLDPPYVTRHNNNGFVDYNETLFSWKDQERLARVARSLADRGATVIVSNAHHQETLDLYRSFRVISVSKKSTIAANPSKRGTVQEALLIS